MAFELEIRPRFRDIVAMNHVNNGVYFTYMEQARRGYYLKLSNRKALQELEFILANASCDFRSPIAFGDTVLVRVWPTRIGNSSFTLRYEMKIKEDGRLAAEGESVQVAYDYAAKKTSAIPVSFRRGLEDDMPSR